MIDAPIIRISCSRVSEAKLGHRTGAGVLISGEDVRTLRLLAERDLNVSLVCDGRPIYEATAKSLLRQMLHLADRQQWYLPSTPAGPLKPPRLPPANR